MATDWNKMTVGQLKAELSQRNLDGTGKKADLVARLEEHEGSGENEENTESNETEIISKIDELTGEGEEDAAGEDVAVKEEGGEGEEAVEESPAEEKAEDGDSAEGVKKEPEADENEDANGDEEEKKEEDEDKEPEDEGPDIAKIAGGFVIALDSGKKISIPTRDNIKSDLDSYDQRKVVLVHPIKVSDLSAGIFQPFFEKSVHFQVIFQESLNEEKSENGYIDLHFASSEQATEMAEEMSRLREDLTVHQLSFSDKRGEVLKDFYKDSASIDILLKRILYIGNLPPTATEQNLQGLFPDATRLAIIHNEDSIPKGYALAEMPTEEAAERATKMYMNVEFEGKNLIVLKAWFKVPKGLLDADTRTDLLRKVKRCRLKMRGRQSKDPYFKRKTENEMSMYKKRLDNDCKQREDEGLPVPPDVIRREQLLKEMDKEESDEKADDSETDGDKKSPRKNNAPYRRPTPGGRPFRGRRGVPSLMRGGGSRGNYRGGYDRNRGAYGGSSSSQGGGYNQAMQMLVQVSKMLGQGGQQQSYGGSGDYSSRQSYSGGSSHYGGASAGGYGRSSDYGRSGSSYGSSGYGGGSSNDGYGYGSGGMQRKRQSEDDGFGGGKRGPGARQQRRW